MYGIKSLPAGLVDRTLALIRRGAHGIQSHTDDSIAGFRPGERDATFDRAAGCGANVGARSGSERDEYNGGGRRERYDFLRTEPAPAFRRSAASGGYQYFR